MRALAVFLYFALGLLQLAAILAGLQDWLGLHWLIALLGALLCAYIPLLGTILGMAGAVTAWAWPWSLALALFFGPFMLLLAFVAGEYLIDGSRRAA